MEKQVTTEIIKLNGKKFKMFHMDINGESVSAAEEKLNEYIEKCLDNGNYTPEVESFDTMYGYYVPQDIVDNGDDEDIYNSVAYVYVYSEDYVG